MKRIDAPAFGEFMTREAQRFARDITPSEVATWFETFRRTPIEEFKLAWEQHRKDLKRGAYFPTINDLMRLLKVAGQEAIARDWRCVATVGEERCGYPGGINAGYGQMCSAHHRLHGTERYSEAASMQIIEESRNYAPPKTPMELMERGAAQRTGEAERWRASHPELYASIRTARRPADVIALRVPPKRKREPGDDVAEAHIQAADAERLAQANRELALAQSEPEARE